MTTVGTRQQATASALDSRRVSWHCKERQALNLNVAASAPPPAARACTRAAAPAAPAVIPCSTSAALHHRHLVGDVLDDADVVRDEQVSDAELALQLAQQVEDLRLHRHVERRGRLVADDQPRLHRQRARDRDALALAAGELVRIALQRIAAQADLVDQPLDALRGAAARPCSGRRASRPSSRMSSTRMRGSSDANGSWKMIWMSRRACAQRVAVQREQVAGRRAAPGRSTAAWPRSSCTMALPVVVLPQPDSPTSASVRPRRDREGHVVARRRSRRARAAAARCGSESARAGAAPRAARCPHRPLAACAASRRHADRGRRRLRARSDARVVVQQAAHASAQVATSSGRRRRRGKRRARTAQRGAKRQPANVLRQRRHGAGDRRQRLAAAARRRAARAAAPAHTDASARAKNSSARRHLDDLAGIHQRHAVRHAGDDRQVVRDQQQAHALLALQVAQQVEDLRLDRHVERRGRLVGDQEVGLGGERHRDHHALLLAAAHAKRVLVDAPLGLGDADAAQPLDRLARAPRAAQRACAPRSPRRSGRRPASPGSGWSPAPGRSCRCARRARARISRSGQRQQRRCRPSVDAAGGRPRPFSGSRRISASAVMLLPQPDSPTSANVSPRSIARRKPSIARTSPASASSATFRSSMSSMRAQTRLCASGAAPRVKRARARVERVAHAVGEQVRRQHQRDHEAERGGERPPDHRVAAHLVARQVDHAAEAVHRRVDADADVGQHRLVQDQRRELEHRGDQHQVHHVRARCGAP